MKRVLANRGCLLISPIIVLCLTLGALFLHFSSLPWPIARTALAVVFVLVSISVFYIIRQRLQAAVVFAAMFACIVVSCLLIPASNDRNWMPDVARTDHIEYAGENVTSFNLRQGTYCSTTDFNVVWESQTCDLAGLQTLDEYFCCWGSHDIAHRVFSFGFDDGRFLCVSVETRNDVGEVYIPMTSFFKQFELVYAIGEERNLVAL